MKIKNKGHKWSGWPGAHCLRCGQPDMHEEALALGWLDIRQNANTNPKDVSWKSDAHKEYVVYCNGSCPADMDVAEREKYFVKIKELRNKVNKLDEKRVLICGSRTFNDSNKMLKALRQHKPTVIIHGCAKGADEMAGKFAQQFGVKEEKYPAKWDKYGKAAGCIRNQQMLDEGKPDLVLAFPTEESRGTYDMIRRARQLGVQVEVYCEGVE